jgi:hypothetical protein
VTDQPRGSEPTAPLVARQGLCCPRFGALPRKRPRAGGQRPHPGRRLIVTLDAVSDPEAWSPAKAFAVACHQVGVDLTDPDEVERFTERYNDGLAA